LEVHGKGKLFVFWSTCLRFYWGASPSEFSWVLCSKLSPEIKICTLVLTVSYFWPVTWIGQLTTTSDKTTWRRYNNEQKDYI